MAMSFLSEENCDIAENANNKLKDAPGRIRESLNTYRKGITDPQVADILKDEEGQKIKANIEKYCSSLELMSATLDRLHQTMTSLILNSRRANRTSK